VGEVFEERGRGKSYSVGFERGRGKRDRSREERRIEGRAMDRKARQGEGRTIAKHQMCVEKQSRDEVRWSLSSSQAVSGVERRAFNRGPIFMDRSID
jgi:hypothetical protein